MQFLPLSMSTAAPDLHLPIAHTDVVVGCLDRCWSGKYATVTHAKARGMPGTLDNIARECSLIQWPTGVGTRCGNGVELQPLAQQDHRHGSHHHPVQHVLLDV